MAAADAEGAEGGAEGAAEAGGKKKKSKLMLFVIIGVVVLLAAGAGLYFSGILGTLTGKPAATAEKKEDAPPPAKAAIFYDLPDMLVNLNSPGRKTNFLKITVSLQIESAADQPKIQAVQPRIVDTFQTYLRELRLEDLRGSAGLYRLREELLMRVNEAVAPVKVDDVLFKEMLVQ